MTGTPASTRASRLPPRRREEIFATVVDLVAAQGYPATTIEQIAAAAGTSKATLYRHWRDKPTLIVTALKATSAINLAVIDTGRFITDMEQLMDMLAARAPRNIALVLTLAEASRHDPFLREAVQQGVMPELAALDAIIDSAARRGELRRDAPTRHVRELLLGVLFGAALFGGTTEHVDRDYLRAYLHDVLAPLLLSSR